jgi:hypothetical protein
MLEKKESAQKTQNYSELTTGVSLRGEEAFSVTVEKDSHGGDELVLRVGRLHIFHGAHPALPIDQHHRSSGLQTRGVSQGQRPQFTEEAARVRARTHAPLARVGMVTAQLTRGVENGGGGGHCHLQNASRGAHIPQTVLEPLERTPQALGTVQATRVDEAHQPDTTGEGSSVESLATRFHEGEWREAP